MIEPSWVNGDDWALGYVDDCPRCEARTLVGGQCEECGYDALDSVDPDSDYDDWKEEEAYYGN